MNKYNKNAIILAALIHDISKVLWDEKINTEETAPKYVPVSREEFFDKYLAVKPSVTPFIKEVKDILANGNNAILNVVQKADQFDRETAEGIKGFTRKPLYSIASLIETISPPPKDIYYYNPKPLDIDDVFPKRKEESEGVSNYTEMTRKHQKIYEQLCSEIQQLPESNIEALIESILFLLEKNLSRISSAIYSAKPDISLYDHIKTTTALAVCLNEAEDQEKPFIIVSADISGIQNFIYSETNPIENAQKGRSKQFRGKSFYLSLITDTFSSYILSETGMPSSNLLINGGGHFVILLPHTEDNQTKIAQIRGKIQKWFYRNFKGELNLILETLTADETLYRNFSEWYGIIANKLMSAKKQKSIEILSDVFALNLDSPEIKYEVRPEGEDKNDYGSLNDYEKFLYEITAMFSDLGTILPKANFIIRRDNPKDFRATFRYDKNLVEIPFLEFGMVWALVDDEKTAMKYVSGNEAYRSTIFSVNSFKLPEELIKSPLPANLSFGVKVIGKYAPMDEAGNTVLEFQKIAEFNSESDGEKLEYPLLAVLRMDVDNLGSIFSFGLEREKEEESIKSLSRTVNLSRDLNLFFTGYINHLAEARNIYITYSGGDDIFVVGSWIDVVNFAFDLRSTFGKFCCNNKNLTISGGMYLCKESYPIHKAAFHAGEAESDAKGKFHDKDCISLFGKEFKWSRAEELIEYGRELDALVHSENEKDKVSSSYIHFLLGQTTSMLDEKKNLNIDKYFMNMFKIKYSFARSPREVSHSDIERLSNSENVSKKVAALAKLINGEASMQMVEDFVVPASFVILKNRNKKQ
jgi:CRISPR-associated protein Csm1